MTPLQELVANTRATLGRSLREAAERSGGLVSHATINNIELGRHNGQLDESTIRGLALALDLSQTQIREAAGLSRTAPSEFRLPKKANRLTPSGRAAILRMVDALLEEHQEQSR